MAENASLRRADALKLIRKSDRQRRDFLRRFYHVTDELPTQYDLAVSTHTLSAPRPPC